MDITYRSDGETMGGYSKGLVVGIVKKSLEVFYFELAGAGYTHIDRKNPVFNLNFYEDGKGCVVKVGCKAQKRKTLH
jgi:hypothetical protein